MSLTSTELAQTTEQLYQEKINLAHTRIAKRQSLQKALAQKKAENISARYQLEANLEKESAPDILYLFNVDTTSKLPPKEKALANFRKVTLLHFLTHRQDIIDQIRREFVVNRGQHKPTVQQILDFILPKALIDYSHLLSSEDKTVLYGEVQDFLQISSQLFHFAAIYPVDDGRAVDLYVLQDMNAFYGHLVGVLSGLGQSAWADGQQQEKQLQEELKNYPVDQNNFPTPEQVGFLSEELRLFLIAQSMRLQIQNIVEQKKDDGKNFESNLCQILLSKYGPETGNLATLEILNRFHQLPSISQSIGQRIRGIFGQTKEKFLKQFEQNRDCFQPLPQIYFALKLIAELNHLKAEEYPKDLPLYLELSTIFGEELRQALAMIQAGTNIEAEIILDRIISAGTMIRAKFSNKN